MTENIDWAENLVKLQPLTRKLEESINRKEWEEAIKAAKGIILAVSPVGWYAKSKWHAAQKTEDSYYG